jgi:hypothetical protein
MNRTKRQSTGHDECRNRYVVAFPDIHVFDYTMQFTLVANQLGDPDASVGEYVASEA